jgi:glycosyltransferase involved in cell wall biosynthesis
MATEKPLVSVVMPCYQQERYIRRALQSVLAQDYSPLEIIIADDASSDRTYDIIVEETKAYGGPHRIIHGRNQRNLKIETYNGLIEKARGRFIVHAHGDDVSFPDRVSRLVAHWRASGASLVASNAVVMDAEDRRIGQLRSPSTNMDCTLEAILDNGWCPGMVGATFGYERDVLERFAPLDCSRSVIKTDVILPFRAALLNGCAFIKDALLLFRQHRSAAAQLTDRALGDDAASQELRRAERITQLVYMGETLEKARNLISDATRRSQLRYRLAGALARQASAWAPLRNRLIADGWRCRWTKD